MEWIKQHYPKLTMSSFILWISIFFIPMNDGNWKFLLIFYFLPFLGWLTLIYAIIFRKWSYIFLGILLILAFPISMTLGYLLLGV